MSEDAEYWMQCAGNFRQERDDAQAEIVRLRAALKPFSDMAGELFARNWNSDQVVIALDNPGDPHRLIARDFFAVRFALDGHQQAAPETKR